MLVLLRRGDVLATHGGPVADRLAQLVGPRHSSVDHGTVVWTTAQLWDNEYSQRSVQDVVDLARVMERVTVPVIEH